MKRINIVFIAILLSMIHLLAFENTSHMIVDGAVNNDPQIPRQSLAQFVFEMIQSKGRKAGIDTLSKYKDSNLFYLDGREFYNAGHILYREGKIFEAKAIFNRMKDFVPEIDNSLAHRLFVMLLDEGLETATGYLKEHRYNSELNLNLFELDRCVQTLTHLEMLAEAKLLAEFYLSENREDDDAYFMLAELCYTEGNTEMAMQYLRQGVATHDVITFMKLAASPLNAYIPTQLPRDTSSLFKHNGNIQRDTAYLFVQGGPMPDLSAYHPRPLTLFPNHKELLLIDVKQSQMINQTILTASPELNTDQFLYEHNQSAEMLHRTVQYLKNRGKTVFIIGHSYGCYIGLDYLYTKPNLADKIVLMGGDLDEDLGNYQMNEDGTRKFIRWRSGVESYETDFWGGFPLSKLLRPKMETVFSNTEGLVSSHAARRFTQLLEGRDLSNVIYYYARYDEANGRMAQSDVSFLKGHGAKVIETPGDHHSMVRAQYMTNIFDHLTYNKPLKKSIASALLDQMQSTSIEASIRWYDDQASKAMYFEMSESEMNLIGYELVAAGELEQALEFFRLNAQHFPYSWNAHDSLGECYLAIGSQLMAKVHYTQSLDLHPGNTYAINAIKSMK